VEPGKLTVAFVDPLLPLYALSGSRIIGSEGFLMHKVAERYGLELKPFPTTFGSILVSVREGRADVGLDIFHTAERAKQFYYTIPTLYGRTAFIMSKTTPYSGADSLKGKKVGAIEGGLYVPYLKATYGEDNVVLYQAFAAALADVLNGRIAALTGSSIQGAGIVRDRPEFVVHLLRPGEVGMSEAVVQQARDHVVNCKNTELAKAIDEVYIQLRNTGEYQKQLEPWGINQPELLPPLQPPAQDCSAG
jgi:ABC-type amino acid transport substrate-binding protein